MRTADPRIHADSTARNSDRVEGCEADKLPEQQAERARRVAALAHHYRAAGVVWNVTQSGGIGKKRNTPLYASDGRVWNCTEDACAELGVRRWVIDKSMRDPSRLVSGVRLSRKPFEGVQYEGAGE